MSGFSPELIDYLEGEVSFEEFERRREERKMRQKKKAELLADSSLEYYSFYDDRRKRKELEYFGQSAAILDKNFRKAYNYKRIMVMENVNGLQLWSSFNQVTMHSQDVLHHHSCLRLMLKNSDKRALCGLNGHNVCLSGNFQHALAQYVQAFHARCDEPLYNMCIGLTFIHMASQKFLLKRHTLIVQGFAFLNRYLSLRRQCQESLQFGASPSPAGANSLHHPLLPGDSPCWRQRG
ncbi:General transcription factor 3C polypeptide 3 [Heterocephalus glaber]|uniref:General transcription factor 3C polypeptide 3 n=1 Tax=Heterocephalus glaber TaxID=10181 RepID=G5BZP4_HETGA|nr:General transcription factor 3C polypeptide 3 [Heterocephalus glaber]